MNWKIKTAVALTFFSSTFGMKAQETHSLHEKGDSVKKEIRSKPPTPLQTTLSEKDSVPKDVVFPRQPSVLQNDTLPIPQDSVGCDSVHQSDAFEKFRASEYDMLCLIAHCEGVKINAYWDPYGKVYTIGIGNTIRPDGKPVGKFDRIKSEQELMQYFSAHVEKNIFEPMNEVIDIKKMTAPELVALTSFIYNCGVSCLRTYDKTEKKYVPTQFANNLNEFFQTHSDESKAKIKAYMDKRVTSKGRTLQQLVKRRDLEERVLFGDIILNNDGTLTEENALDFSEIPLGGIYSIGNRLPKDTLNLCERLTNVNGKNLTDTIRSQFSPIQKMIYIKKRNGR